METQGVIGRLGSHKEAYGDWGVIGRHRESYEDIRETGES